MKQIKDQLFEDYDITPNQWRYFRFWLSSLLCAEGLLLIFNRMIFEVYLLLAGCFFVGFLLRVCRIYPGESEPLVLDSSAVCFSLLYALVARNIIDSPWRFLLILCSSVIIMPHLIYIYKEK